MLRIDKLIFIIYAVLYPTISSANPLTYHYSYSLGFHYFKERVKIP